MALAGSNDQADVKDTPCTFLPWVAADGRRTASDVREATFGVRFGDCQRRRKKMHLIEAAPFGRLDQMLRMAEQKGTCGVLCPPAKNRRVWGAEHPS